MQESRVPPFHFTNKSGVIIFKKEYVLLKNYNLEVLYFLILFERKTTYPISFSLICYFVYVLDFDTIRRYNKSLDVFTITYLFAINFTISANKSVLTKASIVSVFFGQIDTSCSILANTFMIFTVG